MRPRRTTSLDVARRAGVSQSTVSRVFTNDGRLMPETRARVHAIARELGYRPNAVARSLSTRRTNIIGLVTSDLINPFYPLVLQAFIAQLHNLGKQVMLMSTGLGEDLDDLLPDVLSAQVDGFVIASAHLSSEVVRACVQAHLPIVLFNRTAPNSGASSVACDNLLGGREVADALLDAGHQRLAFIAGREDASTSLERERGFTERLIERGLVDLRRFPGDYTYDTGFKSARTLLESSDPPDALFCANDITAMGALDAARTLGVRVPHDLAVIGFDDIPPASWSTYGLSTVRQPLERMIERSLERLLQLIDGENTAPTVDVFAGTLIRRGSTLGEPT